VKPSDVAVRLEQAILHLALVDIGCRTTFKCFQQLFPILGMDLFENLFCHDYPLIRVFKTEQFGESSIAKKELFFVD